MATTVMRVLLQVLPIILLILILIRIRNISVQIYRREVVRVFAPVKRFRSVAVLSVCHIEVLLVHDSEKEGRGQ